MMNKQCVLIEETCHGIDFTQEMAYFANIITFLLMIVNIPGNILQIVAMVIDPYKNLRTPFNFLMTNLAVTDLIVGIVTEPISIYMHWKEGIGDHVTKEELRVFYFSYFLSCTSSLLSVGSLAIERYLAIRYPYSYRRKISKRRILMTAMGIWIIAVAFSSIYFKVGYVKYAFIFTNTAVVITVSIICCMYCFMCRTLKRRAAIDITKPAKEKFSKIEDRMSYHDQSANHKTQECINAGETSIIDGCNVTEERNNQGFNATARSNERQQVEVEQQGFVKWEERTTKRFMVILLLLLVCYGPSTILIYTMMFCTSCSCKTIHWLKDAQFLFVIANSSFNFFAYAIRSSRFRKAFVKILQMKSRQETLPADPRNADSTADIINM